MGLRRIRALPHLAWHPNCIEANCPRGSAKTASWKELSFAMRLVVPRLLITDDDRDFRETVAGALADRGFQTLQASDGEEALDIVGRQEVHLLLLDMHMPRLSGLETIERLRELDLGHGFHPDASRHSAHVLPLPWILISGGLDDETLARARAAAVFSVLPKPVRLPELTGAIARALEQAYDWHAL
jgi:CheY-like chemotaxis protein